MAVSHSGALKRKASGARKRASRDKRKFELGSIPAHPTISDKDVKKTRHSGKVTAKHSLYANVFDPVKKIFQKAKLLTEKENPANRNYARQNIITKGAIINTDIGDVKVTSRPGQTGSVNAILLGKK